MTKSIRECFGESIDRLKELLIEPRTKTGRKAYDEFLYEESENLAFLMSRVVCLVSKHKTLARSFLVTYLDSGLLRANDKEPGVILAKKVSKWDVRNNVPEVQGYEDYPGEIYSNDMSVVTRVMVGQFLAVWSFNRKSQMKEILDRCIDEVLDRNYDDITALEFKNNNMLTENSEQNVYFVCHIVLLATQWGHLKCSQTYFEILHPIVLDFFKTIYRMQKKSVFRATNVEVFVEIAFCLLCLGDETSVEGLVGDCVVAFQKTNYLSKNSTYHRRYHTYILWALFFAKLLKNRKKK